MPREMLFVLLQYGEKFLELLLINRVTFGGIREGLVKVPGQAGCVVGEEDACACHLRVDLRKKSVDS